MEREVEVKPLIRVAYTLKQTKLVVVTDSPEAVKVAVRTVKAHRETLERYVKRNPSFLRSLEPVEVSGDAPEVVRRMAEAGLKAGVGPMAAVAGALADLAVERMLAKTRVAVVENGGEVSANSEKPVTVGVLAGKSPLSGRIGFLLPKEEMPVGIGTSSGTTGHALSFGLADAATVVAADAALADAAATAVGNVVRGDDAERAVQAGLEVAENIEGVRGALVIMGDYAGLVGKLPRMIRVEGDIGKYVKSVEEYLPPRIL
ncbi:MAG: UPF0280 family protein [Candidatus Freyarchaeota archaeon]|nr:UPF0280 family protein [Candidatus Freyrarchaeum guaymaensis]